MSTVNTISTLDGLFKQVYGDGVVSLLPDFAIISRRVDFKPTEKIGDSYVIPVKLQYEGGFSYGASGSGAFNLNGAVAGRIAKAQVNASQIVLRSQIDYESAFKAAGGGKVAFQDVTQATVENMMESFAKRQELAMLYGASATGLGAISTVTVSTNATITFSTPTWSPGIWVGMENHVLDAYTTGNSKVNTNAGLTIVSVNMSASQIVVSGNSTDLAALAATNYLVFQGAFSQEMTGLDAILTNTGTLFNISAATYALWKSGSYAVGGPISMEKTLLAAAQAVPLGLKEDTMLLLAAKRWANLNNDLAALRRSDQSYKVSGFENGVEGITYHGVSGKLEIVAHPFIKEGEAMLLPEKRLKRVGATDITFKRPGNPNNIFKEIEGQAGFELRSYSDQQIFLEAPAYAVKLTGITD
jgi:hypothetical protein